MDEPPAVAPYTRRVLIAVFVAAGAVLVLFALRLLLTGLLVTFAGVLFGVFLNQFSRTIARLAPMAYRAAFTIAVVALLFLAGGTIAFMGARITEQAAEFTEQFNAAVAQTRRQLEQIEWPSWLDPQGNGASGLVNSTALPSTVMSTARSALVGAISVVTGIVLVAFLGFYFALQPGLYHEGIVRLFPTAHRDRAADVLDQLVRTLWWWFLGRLVGMSVIGVGSGLGLWLLGVPLPVTLGVIAGAMNFIPNLGPVLASVPAILFGLQQGGNTAWYVAGFYLFLQFIESYFITPLIDQRQVSLPPGLILAAQLLLSLLAGFLGLLLATPLTATGFILVRELYVKDLLERPA